jgi:hypothetical protein
LEFIFSEFTFKKKIFSSKQTGSNTLKSSVMPDRDESMVAWLKPVGSWLKIKTGEAYKGSTGVAGAVVR